MRNVAGVLIAAIVIAGCAGTPSTAAPQAQAPVTPAPPASTVAPGTAAPPARAACPTWYTDGCSDGAGILSSGSHSTRSFQPGFTFNVPEGWVNDGDSSGVFGLFQDTPGNRSEFELSGALAQVMFMGVLSRPWFTCESAESNRGATAADMVAAATANDVLAVSGLTDVTIGGLSGKQLDVRRNPDWTRTCPGDSDLSAGVDPRDERTRALLLDVPGRGVLVVFVYAMRSAESEAFFAEVAPIIESFEFDLGS
jgi:hypothetical protein